MPFACLSSSARISASRSALPMANWSSFSPFRCVSFAVNDLVLVAVEVQRPVFLALEFLDLELALHDEAQRRALHAAGGKPAPDLLPEQGREIEAHEVVESAPRLLRVHEVHGDHPWMGYRFLHRALRDLVEDHALQLLVLERLPRLEDLREVPCDRLAFAVRVRREEDRVRVLHRLRDRLHVLGVPLDELVLHPEVVVRVHGPALGHEVAHVPVGGEDLVVLAEVFLERLRLRRRFDDEEIRCHGIPGEVLFIL